jgi:hypothetical protein
VILGKNTEEEVVLTVEAEHTPVDTLSMLTVAPKKPKASKKKKNED